MAPPVDPTSPSATIEARFGESVEAMADHYHRQRPAWVTGDVGAPDAHFIMREVLDARTDTAVEIGTASGVSTGLLCFALDVAHQAGLVGPGYRVLSYDASPAFYADPSHRVGDAAREILGDEMLAHIEFRNPAIALDAARELGPDAVDFLFIDADHQHPWPALDLLAMLPSLRRGATVALHDINLPLISPQFPDWGAKILFDGLPVRKRLARDGYTPDGAPNVGSVVVPGDKRVLDAAVRRLIASYPWQAVVPDRVLAALGVPRPG